MTGIKYGKVVKGLGGLYETRVVENGEVLRYTTRAKGILQRDFEKLLVGDNVTLSFDSDSENGVISAISERKNSLIRPPVSNIDYLFIVFASTKPTPVIETVDKLVAIAEHNKITPVIVITKSDLDYIKAQEYAKIYQTSGFSVFVTSSDENSGITPLKDYIHENIRKGKTAVFAGASGVGKSTLMNALFPDLSLKTSEISAKIERGKHTTRHVELFDIDNTLQTGFVADTPGFSLIDFERFDFFTLSDLPLTFREFSSYLGKCRYSDCAHVGESECECAVIMAAKQGKIPLSRLASYQSLYKILKNKNTYEK